MEPSNGPNITATELWQVAPFVEDTTFDTLADYGDITFPRRQGDLKVFPRPSSEDQAAQQGFVVLRESAEQGVAALYALAAALEDGRDIPDVLLVPLRGYIDAFRAAAAQQRPEDRTSE